METIVVGVDGSDASVEALAFAIRIAARQEARVVAVHVSSDVFAAADKGVIGRSIAEEWAETNRQEGMEILRSALADAGGAPGTVDVELEVTPGYPPQTLIERSRDSDLLVVGARGLGPLRSILGSVSRRCVEQARCPVTVVKDDTVGS